MSWRRRFGPVLRALAIAGIATGVVVGAGEAVLRGLYAVRNAFVDAIPLPYVADDRYVSAPPWSDGLRLLERDPHLIWRNRAGIRRRYVDVFGPADSERERTALLARFHPALPAGLRHLPTWSVETNRRGFRTAEFDVRKRPSAIRVVCLGDSWTFGANVDDDDTYPRRLAALLRSRFPAVDVEVLNLGVMGYSSHQGLVLLREQALALDPDVVLLGFGMNDSRVAGFRDEDVGSSPPPTPARRAAAIVDRLETLRLLGYVVRRLTEKQPLPADAMRAADDRARATPSPAATSEEYAKLEAWTRVPLAQYRRNIAATVHLAREHGAAVALLFNELWEGNPYGAVLAETARTLHVPLVNSAALLAAERQRLAADTERALGLAPSAVPRPGATPDAVEVVFRVRAGARAGHGPYVVGGPPALGALVPNRMALRDDGTGGDERAGDGVWSLVAPLPPGGRVPYVYTNGDRQGRWEGLDIPALREADLTGAAAGERRYLPVETFGQLPLQADAWHTDATGYRMIAEAVLEVLLANDDLRRRFAAPSPTPR